MIYRWKKWKTFQQMCISKGYGTVTDKSFSNCFVFISGKNATLLIHEATYFEIPKDEPIRGRHW